MSVNSASARARSEARGEEFECEDFADLKEEEGEREGVRAWVRERGRGRLYGFVVLDCSMRMKSREAAVAWAE